MSDWVEATLDELCILKKGLNYSSTDYANDSDGTPFITIKCFEKGGGYDPSGIKHIRLNVADGEYLPEGAVVFAVTDLTRAGDIVGSPLRVPDFGGKGALASMDCMRATPKPQRCDESFIYHRLMLPDIRRQMVAASAGSTVLHLDTKKVPKMKLKVPVSPDSQRDIARVLDVCDRAIEKTEALIEKYQQIKAGLMHDLFTRGIGADGKLRPPREQAPELYQETPIGWIPKDWQLDRLGSVIESVVDGPFGSNLKSEHYVTDPGVRVVRLQNIQAGEYSDSDKAFVSEAHAASLARNTVVGGDILIAGLGEERYPVGRACLYPLGLPIAINKADCFRMRGNPDVVENEYLMLFLNSIAARRQVRRYEQGVTRPRINLGNIKRLQVALPTCGPDGEQQAIYERWAAVVHKCQVEELGRSKLLKQKAGLMADLLSGKVEVANV